VKNRFSANAPKTQLDLNIEIALNFTEFRARSKLSIQVQDKLKRMQENIAPFVHEWNAVSPALEAPAGKSGKGASHMTPCFASRVPTGRFPEEPQGIQRSPPSKGNVGGNAKFRPSLK